MENKFDFSVIVLTYNPKIVELKKTLISVIKQKDVNFEIIISDDCSNNEFKDEIKQWINNNKIQNIKYNFLEKNVGTVSNLLDASEKASGKYIINISSGDYFFDENVLKNFFCEFETNKSNFVFCKTISCLNGVPINYTLPKVKMTQDKKFMKLNVCYFFDMLPGAVFAYTREMNKYLKMISGTIKYIEDYTTLYLALMNNEKISFLNSNSVWYDYNPNVIDKHRGKDDDIERFFMFIKKTFAGEKRYLKSIRCLEITAIKKKIIRPFLMLFVKPSYILYFLAYLLSFKRRSFKINKKIDKNLLNKITTL